LIVLSRSRNMGRSSGDSSPLVLPQREVPVHADVDVLVLGGGPAGFGAAVTAGREGVSVVLVERFGALGGMWTAALVNPYFDCLGKGGLNEEIQQHLAGKGCWGGLRNIAYDPEEMVFLLDRLVQESGVQVLLYALATEPIMLGRQICGAVVETKSGPLGIMARQVIDCTGDADIAARAGVPFQSGRPADGLTQPMTMMFRVCGLREDYDLESPTCSSDWYRTLCTRLNREEMAAEVPFVNPAIIPLPRPGHAMFQWTHMREFNGTDADDLTRATLEGRRQVQAAIGFLASIKGEVGDLQLVGLPVSIGVRETRRIEGEYTVTAEDCAEGRRFDDGICLVRFGIDIHEPDKHSQTLLKTKPYHIPYRCLVPKGVDNLLVAGRPISGTYEAHASYRVTGNCVAMGEAAGVAAAMAARDGVGPRQLDGRQVAVRLRELGCKLDG
jgi:hypothetical protein